MMEISQTLDIPHKKKNEMPTNPVDGFKYVIEICGDSRITEYLCKI
jgi:hypothetical protein